MQSEDSGRERSTQDRGDRVELEGSSHVARALGARHRGCEQRLRGTQVEARVFGVDPEAGQFLHLTTLEVWTDLASGHPVVVYGEQAFSTGEADPQHVDVLVEPLA